MQSLVRARSTAAIAFVCLAAAVGAAVVFASAPADAQTAAKPVANDEVGQLRNRVQQLEEQLVDIQVVLGTLETLARSRAAPGAQLPAGGGSVVPSPGAAGGDDVRIAALETQIRALTAQVQQLSRRAPPQGASQIQGWSAGAAPKAVPPPVAPGQTGQPGVAPARGFGSTVVQPRRNDRIGNLIEQDRSAPQTSRTNPTAVAGVNPQRKYETAYGLLLQQNYGGAQAAFADFVAKHPRHALAGNAQYWLGETYYVRGQYKSAAGAFLTGYRKFSASAKAPDSLLKLAMSLDRLGQRGAACSSLGELTTKFPSAAAHVKRRASQERRRLRC